MLVGSYYAAFNNEKTVPQYRRVADEVTQTREESVKDGILASSLEHVIRASGQYMANGPVSGATMSYGKLPTAGDTSQKQYEKAAITGAAMIEAPKCIGASELQVMITARLLGEKAVQPLGHCVEEKWTEFNGNHVSARYTVRSLAKDWQVRFEKEEEDVRDLVRKAHDLIAAQCTYLKLQLFSCSHVEHMMCEVRKYLGDTHMMCDVSGSVLQLATQ